AALSGTYGKAAAEGLLSVYHRVRQHLKETEASIAENRRRKEALLREAEKKRPEGPDQGSGTKRSPYGSSGDGREKEQRLLELSTKAMQIQEAHRKFLLPLKGALLEGLGRFSDRAAVDFLQVHFLSDPDEDLSRAIVPALSADGTRGACPRWSR